MLTGPSLGAAIESAIGKKGVTQADVARHFDVTPPAVRSWIATGRINKSRLDELFAYFDDSVSREHWGLRPAVKLAPRPATATDVQPEVPRLPIPVRLLPVVGRAKGGPEDSYFEERFEPGDRYGDVQFPAPCPEAYSLQIVGDSMEPRYMHGEFVVVYPEVVAQTGDFVFVKFRDGRRMVKRVTLEDDGWLRLTSLNPQYAPLLVALTELEDEHGLAVISGPVPRRLFFPYVKED